MAWVRTMQRALGGYRLVRRLVGQVDDILREQRAQTLALQKLASAAEKLVQAQLGTPATGFRTGSPDGEERSGQVRTSDREFAGMIEVELALTRSLGRMPTDEEIVQAYDELVERTR